jgi:Helicase HerA, central domain
MKSPDIEKLGQFYLGRHYDLEQRKVGSEPVLYDSKQLTTHAVCVGMTGSGKTGLCLSLLEETAIDGIPVIAIDPKGDLGNLLLSFPELRGEDFGPWVDPDEATRKGLSREQFADQTAKIWQEGLSAWGQDSERIKRFRNSADLAIYTPGSSAGLPLTVLRSFAAPPPALIGQPEAYRERVASSVSGLLALLGIEADPISSREHILLASVLDHAWRAGLDLDMASLIHTVQSPPFEKVGVIDLETFFPAKERFALAMKLNNLIASPGFAGWMEGESLDVGSLLYTQDGKPRLSILSIAHLADAERMFFVTILLNEVLAWIRTQPGTSSLRAVLYMDEIFGYFPPTAKPPSKMPMLTLLKQARAFGLGIVLATQNPVDLDYKGLSNTGTWFLGRLQTKRDKERVLEGLEGASNAAGHSFDRSEMDRILSSLGNRVFLMNNVHEDQPVVFQTRWALSYLRGPLTREQIQILMAPRKLAQAVPSPKTPAVETASGLTTTPAEASNSPLTLSAGNRPVMPPDVPEFFIPRQAPLDAGVAILYRPVLVGIARLHYADKKTGIDFWETLGLLQPVGDKLPTDVWHGAHANSDHVPQLDKSPEPGATFTPLPSPLSRAKSYAEFSKALKGHLYREHKLSIWFCPDLKAYSKPGESQRDFRLRLSQGSREVRDQAIEELRAKYAPKRTKLYEQVRKARERLDREQAQASKAKWDAAAAFGNSILGAFLGRKTISKTNVSKATSAAKAAGKAIQRSGDTGTAQAALDEALEKFTDMEVQVQAEIEKLETTRRPEALVVQTIELPPKKADITIEQVVLAWTPWTTGDGGQFEAAY